MKKIIFISILFLFNLTEVYSDTWHVTVKCTLKSIINKEMEHMNGEIVFGEGKGKTYEIAKKAAIKDANDNRSPEGVHAKHCRVTYSFKQKFLIPIAKINDEDRSECTDIVK